MYAITIICINVLRERTPGKQFSVTETRRDRARASSVNTKPQGWGPPVARFGGVTSDHDTAEL